MMLTFNIQVGNGHERAQLHSRRDIAVAKNAIQNGGQKGHSQNGEQNQNGDAQHDNNNQGEPHLFKTDDSKCASCKKTWDTLRSKGTPTECSFCRERFCLNCADMTKLIWNLLSAQTYSVRAKLAHFRSPNY